MSNYLSNVAIEYGVESQIFRRKLLERGLSKKIPKLLKRRALLTDKEIAIIYKHLGEPQKKEGNYFSNIAVYYGVQARTLKSRAKKVALYDLLPKLSIHKARFDDDDIALIHQFLGPPEYNIRRMC